MASQKPANPNRPHDPSNQWAIKAALLLGLGMSQPAALPQGEEGQIEQNQASTPDERKNELKNLQSAIDKVGQLTPDDILDEIDVQQHNGNISDSVARALYNRVEEAKVFKGLEEERREEEKAERRLATELPPKEASDKETSSFGSFVILPDPRKEKAPRKEESGVERFKNILKLLKLNEVILVEAAKQRSEGMLNEEEYEGIVGKSLLSERPIQLSEIIAMRGQAWKFSTIKILKNLKEELVANRIEKTLIARQLEAGEIDQERIGNLRKSKIKSALANELRLNEVDHWLNEGFLTSDRNAEELKEFENRDIFDELVKLKYGIVIEGDEEEKDKSKSIEDKKQALLDNLHGARGLQRKAEGILKKIRGVMRRRAR